MRISRKFAPLDMAAERIVLDASVAIEWFLPGGGPGQKYAEGILERIGAGELVPAVPDLWQGYDVVYFELARRIGVPIATLDGGMRTACGMFRVKLL